MLKCCNHNFYASFTKVVADNSSFFRKIEFGVCPHCGVVWFKDYSRRSDESEVVKLLRGDKAKCQIKKWVIEKRERKCRASKSNQNVYYGDFEKTDKVDENGLPVYNQLRINFNGEVEKLNEVTTKVYYIKENSEEEVNKEFLLPEEERSIPLRTLIPPEEISDETKTMQDTSMAILQKRMPTGRTFQEAAIENLMYEFWYGNLKVKEMLDILTFMRDTSGQKPPEPRKSKSKSEPIPKMTPEQEALFDKMLDEVEAEIEAEEQEAERKAQQEALLKSGQIIDVEPVIEEQPELDDYHERDNECSTTKIEFVNREREKDFEQLLKKLFDSDDDSENELKLPTVRDFEPELQKLEAIEAEPVIEPLTEPVIEPVIEPTPQPTPQPAPQPTSQQKPAGHIDQNELDMQAKRQIFYQRLNNWRAS